MPTSALFRDDPYLRQCTTRVTHIDESGLTLEHTVFYPHGGGQLGDTGVITLGDGSRLAIADARKSQLPGATPDDVLHVPAPDQLAVLSKLAVGDEVAIEIDWARRNRMMRLHTASHLMCGALPYPVDGCSITPDYARLDFVTSEPLARDEIDATLAKWVEAARAVTIEQISDEALQANPDLVRTMSVKPPSGFGTVRLVRIDGIDLQPCGGTHVANTAEIGPIHVTKMEKKTARTRRVVLGFIE
ncbi:alanyl-tRNA editing protein [Burkholderia gladioli]|uniref:alanyl-tRNA editing protein n=1 Tax=Burkholderia gladioli TaxID=28095 RepID=UPI00163EF357|nr:alanyl-tRNA editing protein [Burkholderia gladioli]